MAGRSPRYAQANAQRESATLAPFCACYSKAGARWRGQTGERLLRPNHSVFFAALGAPVNWRILWNGRSPPCELPVQHVAERAWSESNPLGEASGGEPVSRNEVNSIRPRDADERRPARLRG